MIGVGIDAVDVERFRTMLDRRPTLLGRMFTEGELSDLAQRVDPVPGLAARFAAKEATMKALGVGLGAVSLSEIEVQRLRSGAPMLALSGRAAALARQRGASVLHLSMTHTATVAEAVVIADENR